MISPTRYKFCLLGFPLLHSELLDLLILLAEIQKSCNLGHILVNSSSQSYFISLKLAGVWCLVYLYHMFSMIGNEIVCWFALVGTLPLHCLVHKVSGQSEGLCCKSSSQCNWPPWYCILQVKWYRGATDIGDLIYWSESYMCKPGNFHFITPTVDSYITVKHHWHHNIFFLVQETSYLSNIYR